MNESVFIQDVRRLSLRYIVEVEDDLRTLMVSNFNLPPGYNRAVVPVRLQIPKDYPESPPGVGFSKVLIPGGLRFKGRKLKDYHPYHGPRLKWAWLCYVRIDWDPCRDDLETFFEILRANLTEPRLRIL